MNRQLDIYVTFHEDTRDALLCSIVNALKVELAALEVPFCVIKKAAIYPKIELVLHDDPYWPDHIESMGTDRATVTQYDFSPTVEEMALELASATAGLLRAVYGMYWID